MDGIGGYSFFEDDGFVLQLFKFMESSHAASNVIFFVDLDFRRW